MIVENEYWSVKEFVDLREKIDESPPFQRGPVWGNKAKQLLVDTIFCGFDIPKIFLQKIPGNGLHEYSVTDGQQRLRAIWDFVDGKIPVIQSPYSSNNGMTGKYFSELSKKDRSRFLKYEVVASVIVESKNDEIRELFWRLQQGSTLNSAEKRNCMPSVLGDHVRSMSRNHSFFRNSGCSFTHVRHRADEICTYAFALEISGATNDLKAPNLKNLYESHKSGVPQTILSKVNRNLNYLNKMLDEEPKCLKTKWGFVDVYLLVSKQKRKIGKPKDFVQRYLSFESRRREYNSDPSKLVSKKKPSARDKRLYDYISAFNSGGSTAKNIEKRHSIFDAEFG